ncbi:hypothetical protein GA0070216_11795 [Micromonospora matsumotoense]|uniref:Uncharacterized protein n=1 Tax=Micromonospora matsumotoense TaxID=121616 RepID=A0A1C5AHP7_9ACTN|nr:hypothetical protein GA0070216_11795 [Micromonospora matsumotoense]
MGALGIEILHPGDTAVPDGARVVTNRPAVAKPTTSPANSTSTPCAVTPHVC